jgi:predicted AlkP superfamily pyrophosphatase or phosphodiesterase
VAIVMTIVLGLVWAGRDTSGSVEPGSPMVLAISIDALNPDAITRLGKNGAPSFHRLLREGASTLNARTATERTETLPNHTGMLTGRGVSGRLGHGVTVNTDPGGTVEDVHGSYVPSMFDVAHDHGLTTALLAEKAKFDLFLRSWDATHGARDTTGPDDGRDKIDLEVVGEDAPVMDRLLPVLREQRASLMFLHLRAADRAGHTYGWLSDQYLTAVRSIDAELGQILAVVDRSAELRRRLTIVLTADHGGPKGYKRHDDTRLLADYRIPFVIWGRGVDRGSDLYALNPRRKDPGSGNPAYSAAGQPVRNMDVEATALALLGLPQLTGTTSSAWPPLRWHSVG